MLTLNKDIIKSDELRLKLKSGIDKLADAVAVTMGARGRNVLIDTRRGIRELKSDIGFGQYLSHITKDGVTVAKSIELTDTIENIGASIIKDAAIKTAEIAGDGTTTATVLARAVFNNGIRSLAAGANPIELKIGTEIAAREIVSNIQSLAVPCTESYIKHIAEISANGDKQIAKLISDAVIHAGIDGIIKIVPSNDAVDEIEFDHGFSTDVGIISQQFTDNGKNTVIMNNPLMLFYKGDIRDIKFLKAPLEFAIAAQRPIMIYCDSIDDAVLRILLVNKARGKLKIGVSPVPGLGFNKLDELKDIQSVVGGRIFTDAETESLETISLADFGTCDRIESGFGKTTFFGVDTESESVLARVEYLKERIHESATNGEYQINIDRFKTRLARLTSGICLIKVGKLSDQESLERQDRYDDALFACYAALSEGILAGGGVSLIKAADKFKTSPVFLENCNSESKRMGMNAVIDACYEPLRTICSNAGLSSVFYETQPGYNALTGEVIEDMIDAGIIDPAKVERVALEHAVSVAGILLTTEIGVINNQ